MTRIHVIAIALVALLGLIISGCESANYDLTGDDDDSSCDCGDDDDSAVVADDDDAVDDDDSVDDDDVVADDDDAMPVCGSVTVTVELPQGDYVLNVQLVHDLDDRAGWWSNSVSGEDVSELSLTFSSDDGWNVDAEDLLGVAVNVTYVGQDNWLCYGHYDSAEIDADVEISISYVWDGDSQSYDEDDVGTFSPGEEDEIELGCAVWQPFE